MSRRKAWDSAFTAVRTLTRWSSSSTPVTYHTRRLPLQLEQCKQRLKVLPSLLSVRAQFSQVVAPCCLRRTQGSESPLPPHHQSQQRVRPLAVNAYRMEDALDPESLVEPVRNSYVQDVEQARHLQHTGHDMRVQSVKVLIDDHANALGQHVANALGNGEADKVHIKVDSPSSAYIAMRALALANSLLVKSRGVALEFELSTRVRRSFGPNGMRAAKRQAMDNFCIDFWPRRGRQVRQQQRGQEQGRTWTAGARLSPGEVQGSPAHAEDPCNHILFKVSADSRWQQLSTSLMSALGYGGAVELVFNGQSATTAVLRALLALTELQRPLLVLATLAWQEPRDMQHVVQGQPRGIRLTVRRRPRPSDTERQPHQAVVRRQQLQQVEAAWRTKDGPWLPPSTADLDPDTEAVGLGQDDELHSSWLGAADQAGVQQGASQLGPGPMTYRS